MIVRSLFFILIYLSYVDRNLGKYFYDVREIEVPVDHFNFVNDKTFKIRYLINDTNAGAGSPIFFYTGNEGDIELFAENSGFIWDLGNKLNAIIVFAEHRYYGKSLPFGNDSFNGTANYGFLTAEQALADYAYIANFLKGDKKVPIIAFGGSYGGMLAAWFRMKYPHIVYGALAASAPIWQFNGLTSCDIFSQIVTSIYNTSYSVNCSLNIKRSWGVFKNYTSTDSGKAQLQKIFNFCNPLNTSDDLNSFFDYLGDVYANLAMANYPYGNDFIVPLPAYPVREFCFHLKEFEKDDTNLLIALRTALNIYTNSSGTSKCFDYTSAYSPKLGGNTWDIQMCNEMVMPMCSRKDSMFPAQEWNFETYSDNCYKRYKIHPRKDQVLLRYGGKNLESHSNIIFSNGLLDPWSGGGVLHTSNDKIVVIIIPEGAHHIDLRSANANDPKSVVQARILEADVISQWISEYNYKI